MMLHFFKCYHLLVSKNHLGKLALQHVRLPLLCLSCTFFCGQVFSTPSAQDVDKLLDLPLDQLVNVEVVSASRFKQKSSEAPSAVDVVTAEDIRSFGWRTLGDALNAMRGLHVSNDRSYSHVGVRGFLHNADSSSRILLMVDGRRMNDNIFDGGFVGEEFMVDMNLIERIEFMPGSGSSLYGSNALLGVINVITKQGKTINGTKISGEAGSLDTYRGRATFGKQWDNGADLLVNASQFYSGGADKLFFPEFASNNGGIAQNADREQSRRLFGQFSYGDFTLRSGYVERDKRIPTAPFRTLFNDPDSRTNIQQMYVDLDYNTVVASDLALQLRGFYHRSDYSLDSPLDENGGVSPLDRIIEVEQTSGRWWGGEAKLTGTMFDHHKWTLGVEFQYDQKQRIKEFVDGFANSPEQLSDRNGIRSGLYLQDEYRITDNLLINLGFRLDQHHMIKDLQINPRVAVIWDITPSLTGKLLYGSAFRAPNVFERDLNDSHFGFRANPNNAEEHIKSYEGIVEWRPGDGYRVMGNLFYNDFTRLLEHQEDDPLPAQFTNGGKFHSYGFELEAEKRWHNGRLLKLAWTHSTVKDDDQNGIIAADAPQNLVKLHYAEPLFEDTLRLSFEEIFIDDRRTLKSNIAPYYNLFNINLSLTKPFHGFQPTLGIYNVLDQHYSVLGGNEHRQDTLAMDGRTVRFRLEYGF
jgi:outer membrane receptor for ferrienterochelin and colicins